MSEPRPCNKCGVNPEVVRSNGAGLGRCAECAGGQRRQPIGFVSAIEGGRRFRKKTGPGKWEPCDKDGNLLSDHVSGRLADIMDRYKLVPAGAHFAGSPALPVGTGQMARAEDPETSKKAADRIVADPESLAAQQLRVLRTVPRLGDGITDGHGAILAEIHPGSFSKRRGELAAAGLVECVGEGRSPYNRPAQLWRRTAKGEIAVTRYRMGVLS